MRPFFKTWLTICLLLPLAAHATNREQRLPEPAGHTAKNEKAKPTVKLAKNETATKTAKPSAAAKHKTPTEARNC